MPLSNGSESIWTTKPVWALAQVSNHKVGLLHQASALTPAYQEEDSEQHGKAWERWWWEILALLSGGQPTQNWHWLGWDGCAKVRAAEESTSREASKAERNHKSASPLSFHNWAHFTWTLFICHKAKPTKDESTRIDRVDRVDQECSQGSNMLTERERASHNWLIPQQGGSKSLYLSQSRAKVEWWTGMTILNAYFPIHIFQVAVTERDRLKGFCCDLPYSKQHYMKKDNS